MLCPNTHYNDESHKTKHKAYDYVQVGGQKGMILFSMEPILLFVINVCFSTQVWDVERNKILRNMRGHAARVGALCWNNYILSRSGGILCTCLCVHSQLDISRRPESIVAAAAC